MVAQQAEDDPVVLGGVLRPVDMRAVRLRGGLELLQIGVEMGEGVLLDGRGQGAQLLPFRDAVRLAVALLPQVSEPAVVEALVLRRLQEARGGLGMVHRQVAPHHGAARLRLALRCG